MERLNAIDKKLEILLKERGIEWSDHNAPNSRKELSRSRWRNVERLWRLPKTSYAANIAQGTTKSFGTEGRNMKLNKVILIPVLAAIATLIKELYGYEIGSEYVDLAATAVIWLVGAVGIFMHPHSKEPIDDEISRTLERSE